MNFLEILWSLSYFCGPIKLSCSFYRDINSHNFEPRAILNTYTNTRIQIDIGGSQTTFIHFSLNILCFLKKTFQFLKKMFIFDFFTAVHYSKFTWNGEYLIYTHTYMNAVIKIEFFLHIFCIFMIKICQWLPCIIMLNLISLNIRGVVYTILSCS